MQSASKSRGRAKKEDNDVSKDAHKKGADSKTPIATPAKPANKFKESMDIENQE